MSEIILARVYMNGKNTYVLTLPKGMREPLGIIARDVLGFRVIEWQGKKMLLGEKIPLSKIASLRSVPEEVLPKKEAGSGSDPSASKPTSLAKD